MAERIFNYCHAAGCNPDIDGKPPSCCHNMSVRVSETDLQPFLEQGAVFIEGQDEVPSEATLYYTVDAFSQNGFEIIILGKCPFLTLSGACSIEDIKPQACKKTQIGGRTCNRCRVRDGRAKVEWYD